MPSTRAQTRPIMGAIEWFKCFFGAVYEGEPPLCSAPPMPSGSMQKSRLEGRAAPQGPGLVRSALARPAGVVSGSRAAGRLVSAGGCAGRLPPGTLGEEARRVAEMLLASGPLPAAVLRQAVGPQGRRGARLRLAARRCRRRAGGAGGARRGGGGGGLLPARA